MTQGQMMDWLDATAHLPPQETPYPTIVRPGTGWGWPPLDTEMLRDFGADDMIDWFLSALPGCRPIASSDKSVLVWPAGWPFAPVRHTEACGWLCHADAPIEARHACRGGVWHYVVTLTAPGREPRQVKFIDPNDVIRFTKELS